MISIITLLSFQLIAFHKQVFRESLDWRRKRESIFLPVTEVIST